jgi:hypothetical protein
MQHSTHLQTFYLTCLSTPTEIHALAFALLTFTHLKRTPTNLNRYVKCQPFPVITIKRKGDLD